jgi:hypothetical protein
LSVIPCEQNAELKAKIEEFAEVLKTEAHLLGNHGLEEKDFYNSLFRGVIERIRGQYSATMRPKREFVQHILNHLEDQGFISNWDRTEAKQRSDYRIKMPNGRNAVIGLTGAMDGQNTTIFERPVDADEFIIWSVVTNPGSDPRRNAWSGIHTRLSAELIATSKRVDGLIVWDMVCGTSGRPCPKITTDDNGDRLTDVGPYRVPPACIYMFPAEIPSVSSPNAKAQPIVHVSLLHAFHSCFHGRDDELNFVDFEIQIIAGEVCRKTMITRSGVFRAQSEMTPIRRG